MLEEILDSPDTRTADKLKACEIVGDWSGFEGKSRDDLLTNVLSKHGLEIAITPQGEKTLQEKAKTYPLEREYDIIIDSQGNRAVVSRLG